jgi:tRNA-modifying protein YgfZ
VIIIQPMSSDVIHDVSVFDRLEGVAPVRSLGIIKVEGVDAASFLQGQLTQDFVLLKLGEARLAAFCSAKGRMQASFVGFKRSDAEILLICSLDVLPTTLKRLSMFVMRAKAKLTDATEAFSIYGLAGKAAQIQGLNVNTPWLAAPVGTGTAISLYPAKTVARALWVAPKGEPAPAGPALSEALWAWSEVQSGIATINAKTADAFVPQMLNHESVGGVNFKKGCYPGQEVVARSQFRGTLKRRAYIVHADAPMAAGDEVFASTDADQPCGTVAQAAPCPAGGFDAMVSMQVAAASAGGLTLGSASGAKLTLLALPYALLDDI